MNLHTPKEDCYSFAGIMDIDLVVIQNDIGLGETVLGFLVPNYWHRSKHVYLADLKIWRSPQSRENCQMTNELPCRIRRRRRRRVRCAQ